MSRKRSLEDVSSEDVFVYYEHTELSSIPEGITSLRIDKSVRIIPANAFEGQTSLTDVEYEEGLEVIGEEAFYECSNLREQQFPSTLIEIGKNAFGWCECLESVGRLPLSLRIIRDDAFSYCYKLRRTEIHDGVCLEKGVFSNCWKLTRCRLPRGMVTIPARLFVDCRTLVGVDIPSSVIEIGYGAFGICEKLAIVELPAGLKAIGEKAFSHCYAITQLDLSRCKSLSSIGQYAFRNCRFLKDIILPRTSLKRIEEGSFANCESLTHLWVPPTVEYIEKEAFAGCTSLLSVEVPETLKSIIFVGDYQNDGYRSLVNIFLPPSDRLDEVEEDEENFSVMEEMKMRDAEGCYPELVNKLKRRFDSRPLHRTCYFQSFHSLQENVRRIRSIVNTDPKACEEVDFLGMTAFHVLALSHRPWLKLFQELLSVSSVDIMKCYNVFGETPLDYLCMNESPAAACVTTSLLLTVIEPRLAFLGLDWWRGDVLSALEKAKLADAQSLRTKVAAVCQKLEYFERMEVLSLLEMSVWSMKVQEMKATARDTRESCRISCGSNIVLKNVMPFLESAQAISDGDSDEEDDDDDDDDGDDDEDNDHDDDDDDSGDY